MILYFLAGMTFGACGAVILMGAGLWLAARWAVS